MFKWTDVLAHEYHVEELRREAEVDRLLRPEPIGRDVSLRFYWRWAAQVGSWLIEVGCRLQTRAEVLQHATYAAGTHDQSQPCHN